MARSLFAGRPGDSVASIFSIGTRQIFTLPVDANGDPASVALTVWDEPDGTQLTDLRAADGTTPITQVVVPAATGQIPEFYGPDGFNVSVYIRDTDGDYQRLDARADAAAAQAAAAQAAAEAAAASVQRDEPGGVAPLDGDSRVPLANLPEHLEPSELSASYVGSPGANLGRYIARCRAGRPVKVAAIGDSILEGLTVTSGGGVLGTDDCLSLVASRTATRFGNTVTTANHALSGHTVAMGPLSLKWNAAVSEAADLYLIDYGTNDLSGELYSTPVPGYKIDASAAGLERLIRRLRTDVPKADIAFLIAEPYNNPLADTNNSLKRQYAARARDVCAAYGVEVIDGYTAFLNGAGTAPDATLYADTIHPNKLGHARLATEVMKHLPDTWNGPTRPPAALTTKGLHSPENVDTSAGDTGAQYLSGPASPQWIETGTWTNDTNPLYRVTTTAGDKISGTFSGTELYVMLDTDATADLHATLKIDGATVYTDQPFDARPLGMYWVPLATGLTAGSHTYELILTSGTLRIDRVAWLTAASSAYNSGIAHVAIDSSTTLTALPTDGSALTPMPGGAVYLELPAGWNSADVYLRGWIEYRISAATAEIREIRTRLLVNGVDQRDTRHTSQAVSGNTYLGPFDLGCTVLGFTGHQLVALSLTATSTTKTNTYLKAYKLEAMLVRRS